MSVDQAEQLTQENRRQQVTIAAAAVQQMTALWPLLDPARLDDTAPGWLDAAVRVVLDFYGRSRRLGLTYAGAVRTLDLGLAEPVPTVDVAASERAIRASLLVTGPVGIKQRTKLLGRSPDSDGPDLRRATDPALVDVAGVTMRHTLAGGRDAIAAQVHADPHALGYVRRSTSRPCYFCAALISRGPVYKRGSFDSSDPRFVGAGEFKVHDHDGCTLRPVYRADLVLDDVARYREMWDRYAAAHSGRDALNAFRRAYDAG